MIKASYPDKIALPGYVAVIVMIIGAIIGGWLSQAGIGLHKTLYDNEFYRCSLQEMKLEDDLRVLLIEYAIMESDYTISIALSEIPMVKNALSSAIDEEWLKGEIEKHLDDAVDFIFGDLHKFIVEIPLAEKQEEFEKEMSREWEAYPGYTKLGELGIEAPDPAVFIEKIDLPGEITIIELTSLSEVGEEEQKAISSIRNARSALQISPYVLCGLLLSFSLVTFGVIYGLKLFGSGLFLSGLSLYLSWHYMEYFAVRHAAEALETHGLSLLARPEITTNFYNCLQTSFIDTHLAFSGLGLLSIIAAYVVQYILVITKKINTVFE